MQRDDLRRMLVGWLRERAPDGYWLPAMNLRDIAQNTGAIEPDALPSLRQIALALGPEVRAGRVEKDRVRNPATHEHSVTLYRWAGGA